MKQAQVLLAPDERGLKLVAAARAATLRNDPQRAPRADALGLALHRQLAQRLIRDRAVSRPIRPLADEDAVGRSATLQARRHVDDVAGDHALADRAQGHRGLAGGDARTDREPRRVRICEREGADHVDELERRSDRALGVILVGGGRAPHGDHGVADELLDDPAVPLHHARRALEVAVERLAHGLRVRSFREPGEADEVDEQDTDETALGLARAGLTVTGARATVALDAHAVSRGASARGIAAHDRRPAFVAELRARAEARAAGRAGPRQHRAALRAEAVRRVVRRPTRRADGRRVRRHSRSTSGPDPGAASVVHRPSESERRCERADGQEPRCCRGPYTAAADGPRRMGGCVRFEGTTEFKAERPEIWSILIEPSRIGPCAPVPIERVDDRQFKATTKVGKGIFSAKVSLELEVVEAIENESVRLEGHGQRLGDHADGQHLVPAAGWVAGRDDRG